jgi:hypothetical protein
MQYLCTNETFTLKKYLFVSFFFATVFCSTTANAQQTRHSGWAFSLNTFKLNEKFTFFFDTQLRSTDKWAQPETFIFRPAIGYALNKQTILSLGIAAVTNWRELKYIGPADEDATIRDGVPDNRIWQQLIINKPYGTSTLQHRLRLEERTLGTLEKDGENILKKNPKLNARFRYFTRYIHPFSKAKTFQKGMYWALQNEFFFNTIGAKYANNKVFDQSRTYGGLGYRVSKQFDLELGYMFQFIVSRNGTNTQNHITQLSTFLRL